MLFTLLLIVIGNGYIILTNMAMTSVTSYLSVTVFLSAIAYLLCFLIGFARVHLGDSSAFLSIVFGHPCVDVYAETKGQYLKYNIFTVLVVVAFTLSTLIILKGAV